MKNRLLLGRRGDLRDCGNNRFGSKSVGFYSGASESCCFSFAVAIWRFGGSFGSVEFVLQFVV